MTGVYIFIGAVFGLILGSFLNVVVYRTPRHLSVVRPGSFCPSCNTELSARDNVPVLAWLWLSRKCRYCREPISARYPIVEAATAAVFVGIAVTVRPLWGVPGWWAMAASIGVVAVIEADRETCPLSVPLIGTAIGAVAFAVGALLTHHLGRARAGRDRSRGLMRRGTASLRFEACEGELRHRRGLVPTRARSLLRLVGSD